MTYDLILKNGLVIDPYNNIHQIMDIGIIDGKIARVAEEISENGKNIIDLNERVVIPGIIDMHTHLSRKFGGTLGYKMVAETGVTTAIDFAGPISEITEDINNYGAGINVGVINAMLSLDPAVGTNNPSENEVRSFITESLDKGALGLKLLGGHDPLTPDATAFGIKLSNELKVMVAMHAGTTSTRSDMTGMREAIELAKGQNMILAHINAYCRGRTDDPLIELNEAFHLLRENPNVIGDSHLALMNGTLGTCVNGVPQDYITKVCLELFGYPVTEEGLGTAIKDGLVSVIKKDLHTNRVISGKEAYNEWKINNTQITVSFPANLPTIGVACATERKKNSRDFLIEVASTDGGVIPRNNLIKRILALYHLGYLTLDEIVKKVSMNPAKIFALTNKGHLSVGADADITVIDLESSKATMSFVGGNLNMVNGIVMRKSGKMLVTERGVEHVSRLNIAYNIVKTEESTLYQNQGVFL